MKKLKAWALQNDWWLPWIGVAATLIGLIIPEPILKDQLFSAMLQIIKQYWLQLLFIGWGIFFHKEIRKLKSEKNRNKDHPTDKIS